MRLAYVPVDLASRRERLRSLHVPGKPLVLPNAWDAASARAVVGAGFPVVATTSAGVAEALGYEDHQGAPAEEMFAAVARIVHSVDVPVTVDSEAGYGLEPAELVAVLEEAGAAGCNLEDTDHSTGTLRDVEEHAAWLRRVRDADPTLVINARIDVFLTGDGDIEEALRRGRAYFDAGADCVYPITLAERAVLARFVTEAGGPVNVLANAGSIAELAALGVARVSHGGLLYRETMEQFARSLETLSG
jgi:2-methylisocitrate lyase-like PEP mutase family enzyme